MKREYRIITRPLSSEGVYYVVEYRFRTNKIFTMWSNWDRPALNWYFLTLEEAEKRLEELKLQHKEWDEQDKKIKNFVSEVRYY